MKKHLAPKVWSALSYSVSSPPLKRKKPKPTIINNKKTNPTMNNNKQNPEVHHHECSPYLYNCVQTQIKFEKITGKNQFDLGSCFGVLFPPPLLICSA